MKRIIKIILWIVASLFVAFSLFVGFFFYKVKHGLPMYETEIPNISFPSGQRTVLLFSKSTGFRHEGSIEAGKKVFEEMAARNNWFLYNTEEGGVFNADQLQKFNVVIFNNSTGKLLNDEQKKALANYVESGGSLIAIHGAGDNSHGDFAWYVNNVPGAEFSHHAIDPHLQETTVTLNVVPDSFMTAGLPQSFKHTDEWYVFLDNPRSKGFNIIYSIDGESIIPNGNFLWMTDKNFGMGKDHPVAWYKQTGKGRTFYTSMGHDSVAWNQEGFVRMLENAVLAP
ncbi:MAG TPA: ThuA domain-containing protein [Cyclobacteriaceae bacterium]